MSSEISGISDCGMHTLVNPVVPSAPETLKLNSFAAELNAKSVNVEFEVTEKMF